MSAFNRGRIGNCGFCMAPSLHKHGVLIDILAMWTFKLRQDVSRALHETDTPAGYERLSRVSPVHSAGLRKFLGLARMLQLKHGCLCHFQDHIWTALATGAVLGEINETANSSR